ncbi:hypothetical protein V8E51_012813 [Hyaloscypha variabilis]
MIEFARRLLHRRPKGNSGLNGREDDGGFALSDQLLEVTRPQMQSLFLDKLPLDTPTHTVHVEWRYPRLLPPGLRKSKPMVDGLGKWHHSRCGIRIWLDSDRSASPKCGFCLPTWRETPKIPLDIALLFVCRQIYSESVNTFYASLTLQMYSGPTLRKFITSVPSQYLASVRYVWFDYIPGLVTYNRVWEDIRSFSGLKVLCITVESRLDHPPLPSKIDTPIEKAWLAPLETISDLERCDLTVGKEFRGIFEGLKGKWRVLEASRTINRGTGKPYRSCRSCGMTHGSVSNNPQWVGGMA